MCILFRMQSMLNLKTFLALLYLQVWQPHAIEQEIVHIYPGERTQTRDKHERPKTLPEIILSILSAFFGFFISFFYKWKAHVLLSSSY